MEGNNSVPVQRIFQTGNLKKKKKTGEKWANRGENGDDQEKKRAIEIQDQMDYTGFYVNQGSDEKCNFKHIVCLFD